MSFITEFDIFSGQRVSIMEFDPLVKLKINVTPVMGDSPGFGHGREGLQPDPHIDQAFKDGGADQRSVSGIMGGRVPTLLVEDVVTGGIGYLSLGCGLSGKG